MADSFFDVQKAAAVFKHGVLDSYVKPFVGKTGLYSESNRVAFVDGYAGPGRYKDGTAGSPARALQLANDVAPGRKLENHFVEINGEYLDALNQLIEAEGEGVVAHTYDGDVVAHLEQLIENTKSVPTFMFLDPFGLMIPFESVVAILGRPRAPGVPPVEVLINFTAEGIRRIAGRLDEAVGAKGREATLGRLNDVCGGDWWQELWRSQDDKKVAEEQIVVEYADRLAKRAGNYGWWTADVRNRPEHLPVYYLVFLSRHPDGLQLFGEALSSAIAKWRKAIFDQDFGNSLFGSQEDFEESERQLESAWHDEIERNLRRLLAERGGFHVGHSYGEVFGEAAGLARTKHLRVAWKRLFNEGVTKTPSRGDLLKMRIEPA